MIHHFVGARWWKFDFHTHTPASRCRAARGWRDANDTPDEVTPRKWLMAFMAAEIDCVAVTDHNTGEWIDRLKEAYLALEEEKPDGFRPLYLFPGVEITVNGGLHLLAVFDPAKTSADVRDLLARLEYEGTHGDSDGVTKKSAAEVIGIVHQSGALAIPAHVDKSKGLLQVQEGTRRPVLDANTVKQVLQLAEILAAEFVEPDAEMPQVYTDLHLDWTGVLGSDCHSFRGDHVPGSRFTWVKMCDLPNLEGLRLALLDGAPLSILRSDRYRENPNEHARLAIERIEIRNLRHAGRGNPLVASFSPWLSTLIGGRGTGKSTVIEMLRLALDREQDLPGGGDSEDDDATSNFRRIRRTLLDDASLRVLLKKEDARFRITWSDGGKRILEEETEDGAWTSAPGEISSRFPVRLFSQKQVFALADRPGALLRLLDENIDIHEWTSRWKELESRFLRLRTQIREFDTRLEEEDRLVGDLEDVKRQLRVFEEGGSKDLLVRYQRLRRQRAAFEARREDLVAAIDRLRAAAEELEPADVRREEFAGDDPPLTRAVQLLEEAASKQAATATALVAEADGLEKFLGLWWERVENSAWWTWGEEVVQQYEELVARLREEGVEDPSAYGALVQKRTALERRLTEIKSLKTRRGKLVEEAAEVLKDLEEWRLELTLRRQDFLEKALAGNDYVRMTIIPFGEGPQGAEGSFRRAFGREKGGLERDILMRGDTGPESGLLVDLFDGLPEDARERQKMLAERIRALKTRILEVVDGNDMNERTKWFHNHVRELQPEQLDRLQLWWPDDGLRVEYRKPDGTFASVQGGSPGQKSAAILAFVLSYGDEPLILDQPEDDLDNHLIYDLIVSQIRKNKIRRQVIVATHNPNIVVNGDAEMVIAMDQRGGQCVVVKDGSGCLQSEGVREEVCRVMEGGRKAFEERYRRIAWEARSV